MDSLIAHFEQYLLAMSTLAWSPAALAARRLQSVAVGRLFRHAIVRAA